MRALMFIFGAVTFMASIHAGIVFDHADNFVDKMTLLIVVSVSFFGGALAMGTAVAEWDKECE